MDDRVMNIILSTKRLYDLYYKFYTFKSFQFRDPVFGLKESFIEEFCLAKIKSGLECEWGMETRIDLLNNGTATKNRNIMQLINSRNFTCKHLNK